MPSHDSPLPRYRVQKKRLGRIKTIVEAKHFGFIDAEDFQNDVFFHEDMFEPIDMKRTDENGRRAGLKPVEGLWVEFEIDDDAFERDENLRATVVRPTDRPGHRKLSGRDATFKIVTHHPKARRKRPSWRGE